MPLATVLYRNEYLAYGDGDDAVWLPLGVEKSLNECLVEARWLERAEEPLTIKTVAHFQPRPKIHESHVVVVLSDEDDADAEIACQWCSEPLTEPCEQGA